MSVDAQQTNKQCELYKHRYIRTYSGDQKLQGQLRVQENGGTE